MVEVKEVNRFMKKMSIFLVGILCLSLAGCLETGTEKGAGIGAVSGGVIGGVIGHQSGRTAEGVAIGAVTGAVLGGIIGHEAEQSSTSTTRAIATCPNGHQVDVTGFPAGTDVRCPICNAVFKI